MFNKKNTFTDYVDVADFLVAQGYTSPEKLFARGGSAGGLLMGAVVNMRPELFRGVVARVPFVDVVTTMLDESIPLTTFEWDEWGNPSELESYRYMLSYSPYDQVEAKDYPNLLVTTGLHDSQVQYWEPAKWVAKLRATKTDENRLLLKTHMDAGHGGGSGRDGVPSTVPGARLAIRRRSIGSHSAPSGEAASSARHRASAPCRSPFCSAARPR